MRGTPWSKEHTAVLDEHYARLGAVGVAKMLGRTVNSVTLRAHERGLRFHAYDKFPPGGIRFVPKETRTTLEAVIEYLRSAGMDVENRGNGLYILDGRQRIAYQLAAAANNHRVRHTKLPLMRLGEPDTSLRSMTGCAAAMTAGV